MNGHDAREKVVYCCLSCDLEFKPHSAACPECGSEDIVVKDVWEGVNYTVRELLVSKSAEKHITSKAGKTTIGRTRVKFFPLLENGLIRIRIRDEDSISYANVMRVKTYLYNKGVQVVEEADYWHGERVVIYHHRSTKKV